MNFPHSPAMANPPLTESRKYLQRVMEETGLELSNVARKSGLSPETLTRPYNSKSHEGRISLTTLRKVEAWSGVKMPPGMDPDPQTLGAPDDTALAVKIFNALPAEGVRLTEEIKLSVLNEVMAIVKRHRGK